MGLATDLFDYDLPAHLIAQAPAERRDASRLLVVDRKARQIVAHTTFADLPRFLRQGDVLFRNNARVLPARLHARRPTGGAVECLLLRPAGDDAGVEWWCLIRPGRRLAVGATFVPATDGSAEGGPEGDAGGTGAPGAAPAYTATVVEKDASGAARVHFATADGRDIVSLANELGEMPLPPYITRDQPDTTVRAQDRERYQTVYAAGDKTVAVAAPTAGLHFTPELLDRLALHGVDTADLTLHVGLGTFKPIATATIEEHAIHREVYEVPALTQAALFELPASGRRRVAVGTTSVRTIEDYLAHHPVPSHHPVLAEAGLFLHPPATFHGVDALITNFHQPRSTLLCLVSAFLAPGSTDGIAWLREIYAEAIAREYRFFSYGDAMLIL